MGTQYRLGGGSEGRTFLHVPAKTEVVVFMPEPIWKRVFDKIFALAALVFFAPFLILIAFLLLVSERGPIFFAHKRVGKAGRLFPCLKFRTMSVNGDALLSAYLAASPEARAEWEGSRKLTDDPRVTCLGRFLRKTSLDELPQFWNVLVGDMSIVGPRPITMDEARYYGQDFGHYLSVRPGITGPWQVGGRSDSSYEERVSLDVEYAQTRNFRRDIQIIIKTIKVVLSQDGAC